MAGILDVVNNAAARNNLDADYLARVMRVESGGNPGAVTGSYKGLFQLSPGEFQRFGGGNIYSPVDNANAAAAMMATQRDNFAAKYGRPPTPTEAYMTHQQGEGGVAQHLANPNAPAWQNMYATAEGQQKGPGWAKQAIWGNIPDNLKAGFGNVNNVTSADLFDIYRNKVEPGSVADNGPATGSPAGLPQQAGEGLTPQGVGSQTAPASGYTVAGLANTSGGTTPEPEGLNYNALGSIASQLLFPKPLPPTPQMPLAPSPPRPPVDYSGLQRLISAQRTV